jgi:hypothetical protein
MRFETKKDLEREKKAITKFVNLFGGSFKKLGPNDIDYRVFDGDNKLIAYAEVKGRLKDISNAFPLCVAARKIVKLADKRLNPILIWACDDGIIYLKIKQVEGELRWGGRKPREGSVNDEELMVYFEKSRDFKYLKY